MNYSELKTEIADWMHRDDLGTKIDRFIDLFEARASRVLRATEMEITATVTPVAATEDLPSGWVGFKNIQYNGAGYSVPLEFASSQKIAAIGITSGTPVYYTIKGGLVEFSPDATGAEIEWTYYQAIPALADSNTTNWLLEKYPDYYLMGCIHQGSMYTVDGKAMQIEMSLQEMERAINKAAKTAMSGPIVTVAA